jgi:hypothetical protein
VLTPECSGLPKSFHCRTRAIVRSPMDTFAPCRVVDSNLQSCATSVTDAALVTEALQDCVRVDCIARDAPLLSLNCSPLCKTAAVNHTVNCPTPKSYRAERRGKGTRTNSEVAGTKSNQKILQIPAHSSSLSTQLRNTIGDIIVTTWPPHP